MCEATVSDRHLGSDMRQDKRRIVSVATAAFTALACTQGQAYEAGAPAASQKSGITLGEGTAGVPPPGLYMFDQVFTYQTNLAGPGNQLLNPSGTKTGVQAADETTGFLWVPGWMFLGATYDAVLAQSFVMANAGSPLNFQAAGINNTFIVPVELSWKLGDSGFFIKTGVGIYTPDGTINGANGLGNVGNPWWTFQPEFVVSYLKDGWNFTANIYEEFHTKNTVTDYRSGDVLHAEFTASRTVGKWTLGPIAYYAGQFSDDKSSAFYGGRVNLNRYDTWAVGAVLGYDFGPAALHVWALDEVSVHASGGTPILGVDSATTTKGFSAFASLSYRIWAPEAPASAPKAPKYYK
jgi:hypothetical protein